MVNHADQDLFTVYPFLHMSSKLGCSYIYGYVYMITVITDNLDIAAATHYYEYNWAASSLLVDAHAREVLEDDVIIDTG